MMKKNYYDFFRFESSIIKFFIKNLIQLYNIIFRILRKLHLLYIYRDHYCSIFYLLLSCVYYILYWNFHQNLMYLHWLYKFLEIFLYHLFCEWHYSYLWGYRKLGLFKLLGLDNNYINDHNLSSSCFNTDESGILHNICIHLKYCHNCYLIYNNPRFHHKSHSRNLFHN